MSRFVGVNNVLYRGEKKRVVVPEGNTYERRWMEPSVFIDQDNRMVVKVEVMHSSYTHGWKMAQPEMNIVACYRALRFTECMPSMDAVVMKRLMHVALEHHRKGDQRYVIGKLGIAEFDTIIKSIPEELPRLIEILELLSLLRPLDSLSKEVGRGNLQLTDELRSLGIKNPLEEQRG